jgi:hypothetical protein
VSHICTLFSGQCLEFLGLRASPKGLISNQPAGSAISKNQRLKCVRAAQRLALGPTVRSKLKDPEGWLNCVFSLSPPPSPPPPSLPYPSSPLYPDGAPLFASEIRRVALLCAVGLASIFGQFNPRLMPLIRSCHPKPPSPLTIKMHTGTHKLQGAFRKLSHVSRVQQNW